MSAYLLLLGGCQAGKVKLRERYYLGATNGVDSVYYRVTITGKTLLSTMQFRQGWYPSYAVDQLFGDISDKGVVESLRTRDTIRDKIDEALLNAKAHYLKVAGSPKATQDEVRNALKALMRVQLDARPSILRGELDDAVSVIEYDPDSDLALRRAGQKKVFLLSADPNQVIQELRRLAADTDTRKLFSEFADVVRTNIMVARNDEVRELLETKDRRDDVGSQLARLSASLDPADTRAEVLGQVDATLSVLEIE
ncbi:MAG: hypothetical protein AAFU70_01945 [Planctomycetota bacterium]